MSKDPVVSRSTLKRLPLYLHLLEALLAQGVECVSSTQLAREFNFNPTQVRKDLEVTGEVGKARVGFRVAGLVVRIRDFLGWNSTHDAVLVGVGNMGKALLGYKDFEKYGLNIVAAFDKDVRKVGATTFDREVLPLAQLPKFIKRTKVHIGILTVPAREAQPVVDLMLAAGIKAIWNFAPAPLRIPAGVILENARLTQSLAVLTSHLTHQN
ncbi:MAG: redox-sensing transcriptional repressor Rex [Candidatus Omnitrophica bacterium]|nr:redox-sensing transcriptional repressor Rex [Candidatus Omnitrophota bacterium]